MLKCNEVIRKAFVTNNKKYITNRYTDGTQISLFGEMIIWIERWPYVEYTLAEHPTHTTIRTLNDILSLGLRRKDGNVYRSDGTLIDPNAVYEAELSPQDTQARMQANVDRGAALLDKHNPDWRTKIDVNKLDVMCGDYCILGQLYGGYAKGLSNLALYDKPGRIIHEWADWYGFDILFDGYDDCGEIYTLLTKLWKEKL